MPIADQLDDIHRDFPDCDVVAFADISARLVLCTNAANARPQEWLDRLCEAAAATLDGPLSQALGQGGEKVNEGVVLTEEAAFAFVRSPVAPEEALCCSCAPGIEIGALLARASAELSRLDEAADKVRDDGPPGATP